MNYQTKENSKMLVIICPIAGAVSVANLNAVLRVIELSGGIILEPCCRMEDSIYDTIAREEESIKPLPF
jgi:hypothetical protein